MLDEKALRKPTFDLEDTVPVKLGDGQDWHLPKVWIRIRPVFRGGKADSRVLVSSLGSEFDELRNAMDVETGMAAGADPMLVAMNLAAYMLRRNYDLDDDQLTDILTLPTDPEQSWIPDVIAAANGATAPKGPTSGGSNAPS